LDSGQKIHFTVIDGDNTYKITGWTLSHLHRKDNLRDAIQEAKHKFKSQGLDLKDQSWNDCEWFDELSTCPSSKEPLMIKHRQAATAPTTSGRIKPTLDFSLGKEVDEQFCSICKSFLSNKKLLD
jgi:hypothetical protein